MNSAASPAPAAPAARPDASSGAKQPGRDWVNRFWHWVPICQLGERHRPLIEQHLLGLGERDRYLRFGYPATDERIRQHVASLDFNRHELFGIFNRRMELVATMHLAYADDGRRMVEFAVSVLPYARGRGYGKRLFNHAVLHCQNRRVDQLFIHALSENTAMLRIARGAGARVQHDGPESEAWLQLPPDSVGSHMTELVDSRAAGLNYLVKWQHRHLRWWLSAMGELKGRRLKARGAAGR